LAAGPGALLRVLADRLPATVELSGVDRPRDAFRSGVWGYADDTLCLVRPWGFDVSEISVPTRVIYGLTDVLSPTQHGEWLARNVPNAQAVVDEHGGHMANPAEVIGRYRWLVGSA
jgi:pimeloyl-ACP methyl ester carboxylesterase